MESTYPNKTEEVKAKQLEALKKMGHKGLKLDEYERAYLLCVPFTSPLEASHFGTGTVANEVIHPDDINVTFAGSSRLSRPFVFAT
jgi:ATPase family AAA domain-containing protein 1